MRQQGTEGWRTMEANTPGQNTLSGMSGHDGGLLITSSRSGKQRQPCSHFSKVFKHVLQEEGLMQLSWPQAESEPRMYKSNQMQEHYFIIGN